MSVISNAGVRKSLFLLMLGQVALALAKSLASEDSSSDYARQVPEEVVPLFV